MKSFGFNMLRSRWVSLSVLCMALLLLFACGDKDAFIRPNLDFEPGGPGEVISPAWVKVSEFRIQDFPEYDANLEVAVHGVETANGSTQCEFLLSHKRFRTDRKWSPLPFAFYTKDYKGPDGSEDLEPLFEQTLGFSDKSSDARDISMHVTFTRGKVFHSDWKIFPLNVMKDGQPACSAVATLASSSQVGCQSGNRCQIHSVVGFVDYWRHFWGQGKPFTEIDDLYKLELTLQNVDNEGVPTGDTYPFSVPEFK